MLRVKSLSTNQEKAELRMDNKCICKRENSVAKVGNPFNQDSEVEIIAIKKLMGEVDLNVMMISD